MEIYIDFNNGEIRNIAKKKLFLVYNEKTGNILVNKSFPYVALTAQEALNYIQKSDSPLSDSWEIVETEGFVDV